MLTFKFIELPHVIPFLWRWRFAFFVFLLTNFLVLSVRLSTFRLGGRWHAHFQSTRLWRSGLHDVYDEVLDGGG